VALAIAGAAAASLEVLWPLRTARRTTAGRATDLVHAIGNRFVQTPVVVAAVTVTGTAALWVVPDAARSGMDRLPFWGQLVAGLVVSDLAVYFGHRAMHRVPLLWRLHAVHHSSEQLDWFSTARGHPFDQAFTVTVSALPAIALGVYDALPWVLGALFLYYPFVSHANADVHLPWLERFIVTPRFHHWHHADLAEHPGAPPAANFGGFLSVWDHLFGTTHAPDGFPERYGIGDPALGRDDYLGHLLSPLRRQAPAAQPPAAVPAAAVRPCPVNPVRPSASQIRRWQGRRTKAYP
jgi:sterol desaturase/sphingolipid hydroxylase (fatty acid hydroxylase superfamily)